MGRAPRGCAVKQGSQFSALLANDLRSWLAHRTFFTCGGLAVGVLALTLANTEGRKSIFTAALGGPSVALVDGHLREGPGWTGFVVAVLFVIACFNLLETPPAWIDLTLIRAVPRLHWAAGRLGALTIGALGFFAVLIAVVGVASITGWRSGPLITSRTAWDVGLWALGLISLGWFSLAIALLTGTAWWSFMVTLLLLSVARFGGGMSPYIPFAQWIVALHGLPGTLSVTDGMLSVVEGPLAGCGGLGSGPGSPSSLHPLDSVPAHRRAPSP